MKAKSTKVKKHKPNINKPAPRAVVHLDYLRVYHEVLKHEDVLDIDLDVIHAVTKKVLEENLVDRKLAQEPDGYDIEVLVSKVMEELDHHEAQLDNASEQLTSVEMNPGKLTHTPVFKSLAGDFDGHRP